MNVALTRAKYAMWVLGHTPTLKASKDWGAFVDFAHRRRAIIPIRDAHVNLFQLAAMLPKPRAPQPPPPPPHIPSDVASAAARPLLPASTRSGAPSALLPTPGGPPRPAARTQQPSASDGAMHEGFGGGDGEMEEGEVSYAYANGNESDESDSQDFGGGLADWA